jgi:two-component system NtrC family sensor kinase
VAGELRDENGSSDCALSEAGGVEWVEPLQVDWLATLGQLAACAAHDIDGHLLAVQHNIDVALRIARGLEGEALDAVTEEITRLRLALGYTREAVARVAVTSRGMTLYARSGDSALENVRLDDVARSAIGMTVGFLRDKARVVERLEPVPMLQGRPALLTQLVVNLLMNAAQAMATRPNADPTIVVSTCTLPGALKLSVEDDGPGVASELSARIFEPYFTTKAPGAGTGLGLAICREIAHRHGGEIGLDTSRAAGARFELVLPLGG